MATLFDLQKALKVQYKIPVDTTTQKVTKTLQLSSLTQMVLKMEFQLR